MFNRARLQEDYRFPILDHKEIIECLSLMDVKLSVSILKNPTTAVVHQILMACLQSLFDVDFNQYTQRMIDICNFSHESNRELIEMNEENISGFTLFPHHDVKVLHQFMSPMLFYERCREMMHAAQYHYFSMMDIVKPHPERLLVQLSAVVNLLRYKSGEEQQLEEFHNQQISLESELESLVHESTQLKEELDMFKTKDELEKPQREALNNEIIEMQNEIISQDKEQKIRKESVQRMKIDIEQLTASNENVTGYITSLKQEVERLQSGIVKDPDTLKREIETLLVHQARMRKDLQDNISRKQELDSRFESYIQLKSDLDKCIQALQDIKELRDRSQTLTRDYNQKKHQLDKLADDLEELHSQHAHLERISENIYNQSKRKQAKHQHKEKLMQSQISDMHGRKNRIQSELGEVKTQIDEVENQTEQIHKSTEELIEQHEKEMKEMQNQMKILSDTVETYRSNFILSQLR